MKDIIYTIIRIGDIYRIITSDIRFRKYNTACIGDIDVLYESMEEISSNTEKEGFTACFTV